MARAPVAGKWPVRAMDGRPDLRESVRYAPWAAVVIVLAIVLGWLLGAAVLALFLGQLAARAAAPSVGPWQRTVASSPSVSTEGVVVPRQRTPVSIPTYARHSS